MDTLAYEWDEKTVIQVFRAKYAIETLGKMNCFARNVEKLWGFSITI